MRTDTPHQTTRAATAGDAAETTLRRTVRVIIDDPPLPGSDSTDPGSNGFAGKPAMRGLGRYYELTIACTGAPDPLSGYLINIKDIDAAVRSAVVPVLEAAVANPTQPVAKTVLKAADAAATAIAPVRVTALRLQLTPTYSLETAPTAEQAAEQTMTEAAATSAPHRVLLRQSFDFAAAHRLHVQSWSDDDNRAAFGKCNNPSGHGHNYRVEVAAAYPVETSTGAELAQLERLVDDFVIERFDHTHLNVDTEEFGPAGDNPSVEHIARVCHALLTAALAEHMPSLELRAVTVWETDRTCCTYPADAIPAI